jgi:hypothetical protein
MKHTKKFLKTILTKMLRTDVLASFNKDNPFSKAKKYSRTSHVRIYNKGLKHHSGGCLLTGRYCFRGDNYKRTSLGLF